MPALGWAAKFLRACQPGMTKIRSISPPSVHVRKQLFEKQKEVLQLHITAVRNIKGFCTLYIGVIHILSWLNWFKHLCISLYSSSYSL